MPAAEMVSSHCPRLGLPTTIHADIARLEQRERPRLRGRRVVKLVR